MQVGINHMQVGSHNVTCHYTIPARFLFSASPAPSTRRSPRTDFEDETREVARLRHHRMHGVVAARTAALDEAGGTRRVRGRRGYHLQQLSLAHVVRDRKSGGEGKGVEPGGGG